LITLAGAPLSWAAAAAGFMLFRTLDILKPPPIRWFYAGESGGLEVMVDDVVAGVLARLVLELFYAFRILPG
jgi:phosphatidylglycerophosphatase A